MDLLFLIYSDISFTDGGNEAKGTPDILLSKLGEKCTPCLLIKGLSPPSQAAPSHSTAWVGLSQGANDWGASESWKPEPPCPHFLL